MRYALVILDLDGTLADSLPWFRHHVNDVADRFGFRRIEEEEIASLAAPARAKSWSACGCRSGRCR